MDMKNGRVGSTLSDQSAISGADAIRSNEGVEYGMDSAEEVVVEDEAISLGTDR